MIGPHDRGLTVIPVEPSRNRSFFFTRIFATDNKRLDPAVSWNKLIGIIPRRHQKASNPARDLINQERSSWLLSRAWGNIVPAAGPYSTPIRPD